MINVSYSNLPINLWSRYYNYFHFLDKENVSGTYLNSNKQTNPQKSWVSNPDQSDARNVMLHHLMFLKFIPPLSTTMSFCSWTVINLCYILPLVGFFTRCFAPQCNLHLYYLTWPPETQHWSCLSSTYNGSLVCKFPVNFLLLLSGFSRKAEYIYICKNWI